MPVRRRVLRVSRTRAICVVCVICVLCHMLFVLYMLCILLASLPYPPYISSYLYILKTPVRVGVPDVYILERFAACVLWCVWVWLRLCVMVRVWRGE